MVYTIVTALDATEPSFHAFDFAVDLVSNLKEYQLFVVYVTALNKTSRFPYLDHLDKVYNLEIREEAERAINLCKKYLKKFDDMVTFSLTFIITTIFFFFFHDFCLQVKYTD
ncbi:hypothetical protein HMI55_002805 [Coelomomyces lativittatus]|nr:hypothetical protein HMI55_002805 [Coelomomyces lativittatus]